MPTTALSPTHQSSSLTPHSHMLPATQTNNQLASSSHIFQPITHPTPQVPVPLTQQNFQPPHTSTSPYPIAEAHPSDFLHLNHPYLSILTPCSHELKIISPSQSFFFLFFFYFLWIHKILLSTCSHG
jgi:hypothetical protein